MGCTTIFLGECCMEEECTMICMVRDGVLSCYDWNEKWKINRIKLLVRFQPMVN